MHFKIQRIVLWPKAPDLLPRSLDFLPGKINLITGRNRTGKSSISWIIDYVLGSGKCAIPVGVVRDTVAWYGLVVDIGGSSMMVARAEPGASVESSEYVVVENFDGTLPVKLEKNTNREAFKQRMNRLSGLPDLRFDGGESTSGFQGQPAFRDLAAFNFLPQHTVANPYTLFFKADTTEHREKLRTIFPLVLGAVDAKFLAAEREYADLQRQLKRLKLERDRRLRQADLARGELGSLYLRAAEVGLLPIRDNPQLSTAGYIGALRTVTEHARELARKRPTSFGATEFATNKLMELRATEDELDRRLMSCRRRLGQLQRLRSAASNFSNQMERASARVVGVGWLAQRLQGPGACPVCGGTEATSRTHVEGLVRAAEELKVRQIAAKTAPVALHTEEQDYLTEARELEEKLGEARAMRAELERPADAVNGGHSLQDVLLFAGRIDQVLRDLDASIQAEKADDDIEALAKRARVLEAVLDKASKEQRLEWSLSTISSRISDIAKFMELERADDVIKLDIKDLTLAFSGKQGPRRDYLWEIGSGENWMGYHIAAFVAIHRTLQEVEPNYVPGFLVIDQPSQVYFPRGYDIESSKTLPVDSSEVRRTRRIFEALSREIADPDFGLQIIVLEHVDDAVLHDVPNLHVVADWHRGDVDYLIPRAWLGSRPDEDKG